MIHTLPYLKDSAFLKFFDETKIKEQLIKIIVLTFDEKPIQEIQGKVSGGSFSINGSSAMRRTANISLVVDNKEFDLKNVNSLLSINKKIEVLIGFVNTTQQYLDYPIIWFPQGVYVIMEPSINYSSSGLNISLALHDKMAFLNGQCGGVLPASTTFSQIDSIDQTGSVVTTYPTIYQIIQEAVHHFGGEQLGKIIISDIENEIVQPLRWIGESPLYYLEQLDSQGIKHCFYTTNFNEITQRNSAGASKIFYSGEEIGKTYVDFIYPGELVGNAGETIVNILDKIKNVLGNFEYFYDIEGNFRFQEIKNYLCNSYSTTLINDKTFLTNEDDYLVDYTNGKAVYTFKNANIITSFSNSPSYQNIKNDFIVWGKRAAADGKEVPIRYHLAIDQKPLVGNKYEVFFYTDPQDGITKAKVPLKFSSKEDFPESGNPSAFYLANNSNNPEENKIVYTWHQEIGYVASYMMQEITTKDYRTELYLDGVVSQAFGLQSNYYYTELKNEWPKLYDVENGEFYEEVLTHPQDIDFYLDIIQGPASVAEFSVSNIGRRTSVTSEDAINCIFESQAPNVIIIEEGDAFQETLCQLKKQDYTIVSSNLFSLMTEGSDIRSAYEEIRTELYQYTNYNEQISLTALPIYYLEPNTRITVIDTQSGIYGDYMIESISLPLDINGTMNLSCTKALERI